MQYKSIPALFIGVALTTACTIPGDVLSTTIPQPFRIQIQNASQPQVHDNFMNLLQAGGVDQHLYIGPVGTPTFDLVLTDGAISRGILHAVINGEVRFITGIHLVIYERNHWTGADLVEQFSDVDSTTKMFMTDRGDPRAIFAPTYACNPDTDELQVELRLVGRQTYTAGGSICVRPSYDGSYEFRYYPPGNSSKSHYLVYSEVADVKLLMIFTSRGRPKQDLYHGNTGNSTSRHRYLVYGIYHRHRIH